MSNIYPNLVSTDGNPVMEAVEMEKLPDVDATTCLLAGDTTEVNVEPDVRADDIEELKKQTSLYFRDGVRKIDYVLVYTDQGANEVKKQQRATYEQNLQKEGLELEYENDGGDLNFVKVHAPWDVLTRVAELIPLKMPIKEYDIPEPESRWCLASCANPFALDPDLIPVHPQEYFTAEFNCEREKMFIINDKSTFFSFAQRINIVHELLLRTLFDNEQATKFGIDKLIKTGAYNSAFPLNDGPWSSDRSVLVTGPLNDRHLLYETWASPKMWYKLQPLDQIRHYYGEKIAMYFSWLGYYTYMLFPAAAVGLLVFLYGLVTIPINIPSKEICDHNGTGNIIMCPLCDKDCPYWRLFSNCIHARLTHVFDNYATVFFAGFMAVWSTTFLEFWKRRQSIHQYDWDITSDDDEERVRPDYAVKLKHTRKNPVTQLDEPYLPLWSQVPRYCTSLSVVVFMVCCVLVVVFGVIMYRVTVLSIVYSLSHHAVARKAGKISVSISAAFINLTAIIILNKFYERLAMWLTKLEYPRTYAEFENSFIFKMFVFQFLNFYTSSFYIAFFKGRLGGRPGDYDYKLGYRAEECDPGGCLIELCIQLGVVMVGKQALNNFQELMMPKIQIWIRSKRAEKKARGEDGTPIKKAMSVTPQWELDYRLQDYPVMGLFSEYLEMVIQYGFITIFVAAFPLAPFFALLNNFIEIRLDAYKLVTQLRRPIAGRAENIGIWFHILQGITFIGIVTNAFIIGWTSDFVPKMVYMFKVNPENSLKGYVNNSLSLFNVNDFQIQSVPVDLDEEYRNVTECRYPDYREPPSAANKYEFTTMYWHVFCARLAFVIVFEHLVLFLNWLVAYLIPDVPAYIDTLMHRERHLAKEARYAVAFSSLHEKRSDAKRRSEIRANEVPEV